MMNTSRVNAQVLPTGAVSDFDFLVGTWHVANRRLLKRGVGCKEWEEFPASYRCEQYLNGVANVDEMSVPSRGFSGMTVRTFAVAQRRWAIYWINSSNGMLCPPVHGGFTGNRGDFYGEDNDDGKLVAVHFIWTKLGNNRARWQQAFSLDGHAWETNWIMEFTR
jgi:hypothetical protein